jgi:nucleotide-binding universal stress UspA family protein
MFRKILLPVDGTNLSSKAIQFALSYAKAARGDIVAVTILPMSADGAVVSSASENGIPGEAKTRDTPSQITESVVEAARRAGVHCEAIEMKSSSPARAIVDASKNYCCDVIYMTLHTPSDGLEASFSETLAYQVLEKSTIPVLLFR